MGTANRASTTTRNTNVIAGIQKRLMTMTAMVLVGVSYTPQALIALFQSHIDALNANQSAEGMWKAAILAARTLTVTVDTVLTALLAVVRTTYVNQPDALADFGLAPKKATKKDPVTQVIAAARNRATRIERGTRGKKARLEITGTVNAAQVAAKVTEALAPATPATPPAK
jgi:hypothetical protein